MSGVKPFTIRGMCSRMKKGRFQIGSRRALSAKEERQRIAYREQRKEELVQERMPAHLKAEIARMEARKAGRKVY